MNPMLLAATTLALAGALVVTIGSRGSRRMLRTGVTATWVAFAAASVALVTALVAGGDIVGPVFAALALGVTGTVQLWSIRHLEGDPRGTRFFGLSSALAAALTVTAAAQDAVVLALGWLAASAAVIGLVGLGGRTPQTRTALRRVIVSFVIGDAAVVGAALIVTAVAGSALSTLASLEGIPALAAGALLSVAAIARAASIPLHGWLPATLAAPTPVSAILHAGVVNAGALLLLRFSPLDAWTTPVIVGIAGGLTVVVAGTAMLTRPDIKGRLVHSTAAQMGFMLLACALGAWALAILHVVGHALYKSYRFLSAGSALTGQRAPSGSESSRARGVGAASAAALIVGLVALAAGSFTHPGGALILFIVATVWIGVHAAVSHRTAFASVLAVSVTVAASGYVLLWAAVERSAPLAVGATVTPWLAVGVFGAALAAGFAVSRAAPPAVRDYAYGLASGWARPPIRTTTPRERALAEPLEYERSPR